MLKTTLRLPILLAGALILNFWIIIAIPAVLVQLSGGRFFNIPSGSMQPTLAPGDHILALKAETELERGAIYVFQHPKRKVHYIKRLIGLPGESIHLIDGVVHIDGVAVQRQQITDYKLRSAQSRILATGPSCERSDDVEYLCTIAQFEETLSNGRSHRTLDLTRSRVDNWGPKIVPEGHVMMMGDHRDNAVDSRFSGLGFVSVENIQYRPWVFFISFDDLFGSWSKFLTPVEAAQ